MAFTNSVNMGLPIPNVTNEPGPQYATDVNQCLNILDGHTHGPGTGVPIGSPGINIQSDLAFNINNATSLRTVRFIATTASSGTDTSCVYVRGIDLFYNDGNANVVRITQNGGLSTSSQFQGLISTTAIVSAAGATPATSGFIRMNNNLDYLSWRNAANSGDDRIYFDASDNLQVVGILTTGIQANNFRFPDTVGTGKIIIATAPSGSSAYTLSLPANPPQNPNLLTMSSSGGIAQSFAVVSGFVNSAGTSGFVYNGGVGVSGSGGQYTLAFTPIFSQNMSIQVTCAGTNQVAVIASAIGASSVSINTQNSSTLSLSAANFYFMASGPRS